MGPAEFATVHAHFNLRKAPKTRWADYFNPLAISEAIQFPLESNPLVLAAFSTPSWLKWRKSTKTRGADFEDTRNWKRRLRWSRISPSCFGSFFISMRAKLTKCDQNETAVEASRSLAASKRFLGGNKTCRFLPPNGGV